MKKIYFLPFILFFNPVFSQVVFCPPGAEWHYLFNTNNLSPKPVYENESIIYVGDSIVGADTLKVLVHNRFFWQCNLTYTGYTLIKQKGDTIFMKNKHTQYSWQILYNFAAQPGQGWSTIIKNPTPKTYVFSVTSVTATIINGQTIKVLDFYGPGFVSSKIFERSGASGFLYPFFKGPSSDGDYVLKSLCYKDDTFGEIRYTDFPCNYSNAVGLNELIKKTDPQIYPNPFTSELSVTEMAGGKITIFSFEGKEVLSITIDDDCRNQVIDTEDLPKGFYYAKIFSANSVNTKKLVKD